MSLTSGFLLAYTLVLSDIMGIGTVDFRSSRQGGAKSKDTSLKISFTSLKIETTISYP